MSKILDARKARDEFHQKNKRLERLFTMRELLRETKEELKRLTGGKKP